mgnify:CR=1 FL=1|jgi:DNA-directed RNA polymerase subunit E'/Rpb7
MTDLGLYSTQLLTTSINIEPHKIKGDINKLLVYNLKRINECTCNEHGYIVKDSIELVNRSIGEIKIIDNKSYIIYNITYKSTIISPSKGNQLTCVINSNNKMGLIGYIKNKDDDTINDSPFIIIIPSEYFDDISKVSVNDEIKVEIEAYRTKYKSKQIQVVAKPV